MVTIGVGLVMAPGTRHWLNEVTTGAVGVFLPGDEHDAFYPPGSRRLLPRFPFLWTAEGLLRPCVDPERCREDQLIRGENRELVVLNPKEQPK